MMSSYGRRDGKEQAPSPHLLNGGGLSRVETQALGRSHIPSPALAWGQGLSSNKSVFMPEKDVDVGQQLLMEMLVCPEAVPQQ